eukprot:27912-Prymnesium_polylepis.1
MTHNAPSANPSTPVSASAACESAIQSSFVYDALRAPGGGVESCDIVEPLVEPLDGVVAVARRVTGRASSSSCDGIVDVSAAGAWSLAPPEADGTGGTLSRCSCSCARCQGKSNGVLAGGGLESTSTTA